MHLKSRGDTISDGKKLKIKLKQNKGGMEKESGKGEGERTPGSIGSERGSTAIGRLCLEPR